MKEKLLIVEDDLNALEGLASILEDEEYEVFKAADSEQAYTVIKDNYINLLLTDYLLPDEDGLILAKKVLDQQPEIKVIMMTAFGSIKNAVNAMRLGIYDYLTKPINIDELLIVIKRALKEQRIIIENLNLKDILTKTYRFENIIGVSGKMQEIFKKIRKVAGTEATVLIRGESGTGKELIARALHFQSLRSDEPLIEINCASIPETLLESELFGHEKGAFTGAYKQKKGKFEAAHQGTLFLDEIGELSGALQSKLLRVLQDQRFSRVGGTQAIEVDVRLIAATNSNLEEKIKEKKFREDLYYRLNVIPIFIPPLRERKEDISPLVDYFIKMYAKKNKRTIVGVDNEVRNALLEYEWPGNVRELENAIENAVVLSEKDRLILKDLPPYLQFVSDDQSPPEKLDKSLSYKEQLELYEKQLIIQALEEVDWDKMEAANNLGYTIRTLRNKLNKYQIISID